MDDPLLVGGDIQHDLKYRTAVELTTDLELFRPMSGKGNSWWLSAPRTTSRVRAKWPENDSWMSMILRIGSVLRK